MEYDYKTMLGVKIALREILINRKLMKEISDQEIDSEILLSLCTKLPEVLEKRVQEMKN